MVRWKYFQYLFRLMSELLATADVSQQDGRARGGDGRDGFRSRGERETERREIERWEVTSTSACTQCLGDAL